MNEHRCFCELAPLYALDLLDLEERLWVEAQALACADLAAELASYEAAVSILPYSAPAVPMAADLKARLFDRLADPGADLLDVAPVETSLTPQPESPLVEPPPAMVTIRSSELTWQPYQAEGVEVAVLFFDPDKRMCSAIVKAADGVIYPLHQHQGIEEIYMLAGELELDGQVYFAGDYIRSYPDSIHPPAITNNGCKFLVRACIDDNYDENLLTISK